VEITTINVTAPYASCCKCSITRKLHVRYDNSLKWPLEREIGRHGLFEEKGS